MHPHNRQLGSFSVLLLFAELNPVPGTPELHPLLHLLSKQINTL